MGESTVPATAVGVRACANQRAGVMPDKHLHNTLAKANVLIVPDLLEVATEPTRRALLRLLAAGEKTVTELSANFPVSRSAISQHLLLLSDVGLVSARKDGRNRYYGLDSSGMVRLREQFDSFWTNELDLLVADAGRLRPPSRQGKN
ncbi:MULTISPECIES: helix-turn-helix domain-containing protein [Micrococcaceae]|uniref:helix-turn-helix domain-containing protein n=2 Tax=Micrococcales TaxID=85006 RepID=UPI0032B353DB|nr:HTH-type transcriptional regulator [Arthrobacter sp. ES1]